MVRYPVGIRVSYIVILTLFGILFFIADAAWIRGLLMPKRFGNGKHIFTKRVIIAFSFRLLAVAATSLVVVFGITALGYVAGEMVLLGLLLLLFLVVSTLSTLLIAWSEQEVKNPWPAIILSAFILSWVFISSIPLI